MWAALYAFCWDIDSLADPFSNVGMKYLVLVSLIVLSACVSKSKYEDLERNHTQLEEALAQEKVKVSELKSKIEELETLIAQLEKRLGAASDDKAALKASVQQMKKALSEMTARKLEADQRIREYQDLVRRFRSLTESGQLSVKIVDGRMVVGLPSDVLFASGSAKLSTEGEATIKEVTRLLADLPNKEYQVEGHTDNVPIRTSSFASNWELAAARGLNVVKMMIDAGMPPERVSAASYGEYKPLSDNSDPEAKKLNRRIEIVIVPDLSTLPGYEELKKMGDSESQETSKGENT